ncbi:MAG: hypothetical protein ACQETI_14410 [Halobacteriota archaeon]
MTLSVETPDPPEPSDIDPAEYEDAQVVGETNYRRSELREFLAAGAWNEAFAEWCSETSVSAEEWAIVEDLNLVAGFDFFWDDFADRVGYHAPGIPEDWRERNLHPDLNSWAQVSSINAGLTELGQTVSEVLKADHIDWEAEYEAPDDLPDFS